MTTVLTRAGDALRLSDAASELDRQLEGRLIAPGDEAYDDVRSLWNGMIDREPGLIARCRTVDDVREPSGSPPTTTSDLRYEAADTTSPARRAWTVDSCWTSRT